MFWLYFVAGHFVTGLVLILLACLLTWHRPDKWDIRHALAYGYLNILHAPILVYLCWTGQMKDEAEKPGGVTQPILCRTSKPASMTRRKRRTSPVLPRRNSLVLWERSKAIVSKK